MAEQRFTPGPWRKGDQRPFSEDGSTFEVGTDTEVVALAVGEGEEIAEANARLIAAAPELYALVEGYGRLLDDIVEVERLSGAERDHLANLRAFRAMLLARVQGEG